jgi:hypothetical protein
MTVPIRCLALALLHACATFVMAEDGPRYGTSDGWEGSGLQGHAPGKATYWTSRDGATAQWMPTFDGETRADVWLHRVIHNRDNDPKVQVEVIHAAGRDRHALDFTHGSSGWVRLGTYDFAGQPGEGITLTRISGVGMTRISAARFDVHGEATAGAIQSILLDEPTHGPLTRDPPFQPAQTVFTQEGNFPGLSLANRLANRGIVGGIDRDRFAPGEPLVRGEAALWLQRAMARPGSNFSFHPVEPSTAAQRSQALDSARARGWPIRGADSEAPIDRDEFAALLQHCWQALTRGPEHAGLEAVPVAPSGAQPMARGDALEPLWQLTYRLVEAGPPLARGWTLAFHDEFDGNELDHAVWRIENGSPGHILSSRWTENVQVRDGKLVLHTRKESRGGKEWTTGNIWTRDYRMLYGFLEARMKVGGATGLNNAFWLMTEDPKGKYHFEIDVTEARHPNRNAITVHDWKDGDHRAFGQVWLSPEILSENFHVYALEWTPTELVWYFDGQVIRREQHDYCRAESPVRLSSAIGRFAGRITDALDGTTMEVDWVRVWAPKEAYAEP